MFGWRPWPRSANFATRARCASPFARLSRESPSRLVAAALPDLAHAGILPPNDLGSFIENPLPEIRASAFLSLNVKKALPQDLQQSVLDHIADRDESVRQAAMLSVVPLKLQSAVPRLLELAARPGSPDYPAAVEALCSLRDPRALPVYLAALDDENPRHRKLAESALLAIRDQAHAELMNASRSGRLSEPAALALDRLLAKFTPILSWRVLGPFPRITPQLTGVEGSIDFARSYWGAGGRPVSWVLRRADAASSQLRLQDFDQAPRPGAPLVPSSPLGVFGYAEVNVDRPCRALLMTSASGGLIVSLNEKPVYQSSAADRGAPEVVRCELLKGRNRILVLSRQGSSPWFYSIQLAALSPAAEKPPAPSPR